MAKQTFVEDIWEFILGSLRLILFLVTFTLLIISLGADIYTNIALYYGNGGWLEFTLINGLLLIPLFVLILGAHGLFYQNLVSLIWFCYIILASSAIASTCSGILFTMNDQIAIYTEAYLKGSQINYEWLKDPELGSRAYVDTSSWDGVQSIFSCCGMDRFTEWDSYRPKTVNNNELMYPKSCCISPIASVPGVDAKFCPQSQIFQKTCYRSIGSFWRNLSLVLGILAILYMLIAGITKLIIREIIEEDAEVRAEAKAKAEAQTETEVEVESEIIEMVIPINVKISS